MKTPWLAGLLVYLFISIAGHAGTNDYTCDGGSDPAVFDTAGGYWYVKSVDGPGVLWKNQWGWNTAQPVPGDYNGDGKWDQAVFDTVGGYWYIKAVDGTGILWKNQWGWSTAQPVPGDYNGDGKWDQAVFDTAGGYWYIKSVDGTGILWKNQWGWSTAKPIPGDYNGDGKWDQAVFDTVGGYWYIKSVDGTGILWKNQWGWSTAQPVPGDYDGDGKYDLAVFDTVGGYWYIKSVAGNSIAWKVQWGWGTAKPVPGDYNGDGKFDLALYDAVSGNWYIKGVDGTVIAWAVQWGWPGALPVTIFPAASYLVVDLSAGPAASSYPVSTLSAIPAGGWTDEYKTTKMVFRRIPSGTFIMGSPTNELGRDSDETQHQVTLTDDFYMGVFEVTQKQWERVMGTWPSYFNNASYRDARPVEQLSYYLIRENSSNTDDPAVNWPVNSAINTGSFMGCLRARTGRSFDLPTESQWEYAGRAGRDTTFNSGYNITNTFIDAHLSAVGRYWSTGGSGYTQNGNTSVGTAKVGSYLPNAWGLYDMHGNIVEWCLDWQGDYPGTVINPKGPNTGSNRMLRGGGWINIASPCRVANRIYTSPATAEIYMGFRVALLSSSGTP